MSYLVYTKILLENYSSSFFSGSPNLNIMNPPVAPIPITQHHYSHSFSLIVHPTISINFHHAFTLKNATLTQMCTAKMSFLFLPASQHQIFLSVPQSLIMPIFYVLSYFKKRQTRPALESGYREEAIYDLGDLWLDYPWRSDLDTTWNRYAMPAISTVILKNQAATLEQSSNDQSIQLNPDVFRLSSNRRVSSSSSSYQRSAFHVSIFLPCDYFGFTNLIENGFVAILAR